MPRTKGGTVTRARRKKIMKLAKGYRGSKHLQFKAASTQVFVSRKYAFRDRKKRKSEFMHGLKLANVEVNRKMLADIAYNDEKAFADLADAAKKALN